MIGRISGKYSKENYDRGKTRGCNKSPAQENIARENRSTKQFFGSLSGFSVDFGR
jgi:hypothetical protein